MGQKVNPVGFRLGINRSWDSIWYAKKNDYSKFLIEDYKIRQYIRKNVINSGVSEIIIERSSKKCSVFIHTSRPGFVIGKKGSDIEKIKSKISKITDSEVFVNIKEIKRPELNAYLVAENIAQQLVKRIAYRRAMKKAIQSTMRLGAKGIKVCVSGRLAGNEIARTEWLREGSVPLHTLRANLDYSESEALTTYGIIGVKVWIYKGKIFEKDTEKKNKKVKHVTTNKN
jgi:small subunit ribosomal protein S3